MLSALGADNLRAALGLGRAAARFTRGAVAMAAQWTVRATVIMGSGPAGDGDGSDVDRRYRLLLGLTGATALVVVGGGVAGLLASGESPTGPDWRVLVLVLLATLVVVGVVAFAAYRTGRWLTQRRGVEYLSPLRGADPATRKAVARALRSNKRPQDPRLRELTLGEARRTITLGWLMLLGPVVAGAGQLPLLLGADSAGGRVLALLVLAGATVLGAVGYRQLRAAKRYAAYSMAHSHGDVPAADLGPTNQL